MAITSPFFVRDVVRPTLAFLSSSATVAPTDRAFMTNNEPGLVWRSSSLTPSFVVDFGAAVSVNALALLWTNLRNTDTVRWRAAASEAALTSSPIYDSTAVAAWAGSLLTEKPAKHVHTMDAPVWARYWRCDIVATSHPDSYVQIGRFIAGQAYILGDDMDAEVSQSLTDQSVVDEGPGFEDVEEYLARPTWQCSFSWIPATVWRPWFGFCQEVGTKRPVLFVPIPSEPARLQDSAVFGRMQSVEGKHPFHEGWTQQITIVSLHP